MTPPSHSSPPKEESSVLFSLNELMDLENDRIADEEAERAEIMRAEQRARHAEIERRQQQERTRLLQIEQERRAAELRKREEEARLEAIRQAELAKAEHEAHNQARLLAIAQSQEHEQRLTEIREDESKKKLRVWLGLSLAAAILAGVGGGVWVRENNHEAELIQARLAQEAEAQRKAYDLEIAGLTEKMNQIGAKDAERRKILRDEIEILKKQREKETKQKSPVRTSPQKGPQPNQPTKLPPKEPVCDEWDPMCGF